MSVKKASASHRFDPAGIAEIDGEKVDVLTEGEFLPVGTSIQVIKSTDGA